MGWSMPDEREVFTLQDMIENFDVQRVSLGGPIFDVEKLNWLNGQWIKSLTPGQLLARLLTWKSDRQTLEDIAAAIQPRINLCLKLLIGQVSISTICLKSTKSSLKARN